jgi:hypothetical protein
MSTIANITPIKRSPLSLPNIMGMGPINITPLVCTSVLEELEDDCNAVPTNINRMPRITTAKPNKIIEL